MPNPTGRSSPPGVKLAKKLSHFPWVFGWNYCRIEYMDMYWISRCTAPNSSSSWWRHGMGKLSALLSPSEENPPVTFRSNKQNMCPTLVWYRQWWCRNACHIALWHIKVLISRLHTKLHIIGSCQLSSQWGLVIEMSSYVPKLIQVMACRLFGAKPIPEPIVTDFQSNSREYNPVKY